MAETEEGLLTLTELIKPEHAAEISPWWVSLSVIQRSRGRWVFHEPKGLPYPRQRVRREVLGDVARLDDLNIPDDESTVERHNICQWAPDIKGEPLEAWKSFALKSTNAVFQKVPEPDPFFGPGTWMRVMRKSHGGLLTPSGLSTVEAWAKTATERQRSALSELLWSFTGHLTSRRGRSETKIAYGPKHAERANINLIDPFASALGRPSTAPIASAVQRKFEAGKRAQAQRQAEIAARLKADRLERLKNRNAFEKTEKDTLQSNIPFSWAGANILGHESSTQAQMRTVKPEDLAKCIKWAQPTIASKPPATSGMGRHLGGPGWHGDIMYSHFWPVANRTFQPINEQRRPHHIPGKDRMQIHIT